MKSLYLSLVVLLMLAISASLKAAPDFKNQQKISIQQAIALAQKNDPWLKENHLAEQSILAKSVSASALPDPNISIAAINLPSDSFKFNQEQMTQLKIGYQQNFPAGDSLQLKSLKLKQVASSYPLARANHKALVGLNAGQLWLDFYQNKHSIQLVKKSQQLFEQLADISKASYAATIGKSSQQDIVNAQLELALLEEKLSSLYQESAVLEEKLLGMINANYDSANYDSYANTQSHLFHPLFKIELPKEFIELSIKLPLEKLTTNQKSLTNILLAHPKIIAIDKEVQTNETNIQLAEQSYKPKWGFNASYGYRDESEAGIERADFVSVGVTFELPIFTSNNQDKNVESAIFKKSASKVKKWRLLREMLTQLQVHLENYTRLIEREDRYQTLILPKAQDFAESALNAYTNDNGDFSQVVRARIASLNAQIDALNISTQKQKTILAINYYLAGVKS